MAGNLQASSDTEALTHNWAYLVANPSSHTLSAANIQIVYNKHLHQLQQRMDERVRLVVETEHAAFDTACQHARAQRDMLLRAVQAQQEQSESNTLAQSQSHSQQPTNQDSNTTTNSATQSTNTNLPLSLSPVPVSSSGSRTGELGAWCKWTNQSATVALPMSARRTGTPAPLDCQQKQCSNDSAEMAPDSAVPPSPPASDLEDQSHSHDGHGHQEHAAHTQAQAHVGDDIELDEQAMFDVDTSGDVVAGKGANRAQAAQPKRMFVGRVMQNPPVNLANYHMDLAENGLDDAAHESDDSGAFDDVAMHTPVFSRPRTKGAGLLMSKYGTSLPVTINQRYWPPKDAIDSLNHTPSSDDEDGNPKNVCLPHRAPKDQTHEKMRELSRTIQAADDPERLFGERPRRRRYKTGDVVRLRSLDIDAADLEDMDRAEPVLVQAKTSTDTASATSTQTAGPSTNNMWENITD